MHRRRFVFGAGFVGLAVFGAANWKSWSSAVAATSNAIDGPYSRPVLASPEPWADELIKAARSQVGVTTRYDPSYVGLTFPMGDIQREKGVCTDVVIRAYRDAFGIDLQELVHHDMKQAFDEYPKIWGLKRPDPNIDHRRVPNLERFFTRKGASLPISRGSSDYLPGDLITQRLPGNLPHIAIVTHWASPEEKRPLVIHNIGSGAQLEDRLFDFTISGHFRFTPEMV